MSRSERSFSAREDLFSLSVDQYGRLWLHTKMDGVDVAIDLAPKNVAFEIMAETMLQNGFDFSSAHGHQNADNDDEQEDG
jgi:hypothetical protein